MERCKRRTSRTPNRTTRLNSNISAPFQFLLARASTVPARLDYSTAGWLDCWINRPARKSVRKKQKFRYICQDTFPHLSSEGLPFWQTRIFLFPFMLKPGLKKILPFLPPQVLADLRYIYAPNWNELKVEVWNWTEPKLKMIGLTGSRLMVLLSSTTWPWI